MTITSGHDCKALSKNIIFSVIFWAFSSLCIQAQEDQIRKYIPDDMLLYKQIEAMDRVFFDAYNSCDLKKQESIYADNIEFLHDKAGLINSKAEIIEGTKKNICGKVTRQLVPGSIEVYPINNYGAVEIGFHRFFNNQEKNAVSKPSKFIIIWKKDNENWKITRVVSLH
ncbi:MAG TPA: nuclear transport factor 2 family protein [Bacteroidia bacterium]|nr:nuclear transport factor 2 family protein [Bacteroidia bacterium]